LGWAPQHPVDAALKTTVDWYQENAAWWKKIKSGEFRAYYEQVYGARLSGTR